MSSDREKFDRIAQSDLHNARGIELADSDNIATVYAEKGMLREALREYLLAIELEPHSPTAHYNLACFLATHAYDLSVNEYRDVVEIEWDYPDAHLNLGLTLAERGNFVEALREYEIALDQNPRDAVARHEMATVLMDMGRYGEAIPHLREVTKSEPDNLDSHIDLGISYTSKGFYEEAEKALGRALALDGGDIMANYHLAALRSAQGRTDDCIEALSRAAEVERERVRAWAEADRFFDNVRRSEGFLTLFHDSGDDS
jgi:tetratricopeptide (TPR) repeat protein